MRLKHILAGGAAAVALGAGSANATSILLYDLGGVAGSQAEQGFLVAANYWGSMFTNDVTIRLGVKFAPLDPGVIGSTGSSQRDFSVRDWEAGLNATKSNSTLDRNLVLPTLSNGGAASFITQGVDDTGNNDVTQKVFDDGATTSSDTLYLNTSVIKAVGGFVAPNVLDGSVTFSSTFGFDFNPGNGVPDNTFDFIGVAIHEIGHALGFVSGVDFFDAYGGPDGPGYPIGYDLNDTSIFSALDMFRYSTDPDGVAPGDGPSLDLTVGGTKYFSIDGGRTALFGNTFSTGDYQGDGRQASHWKDADGVNRCGPQLGIMDPTFCFGQKGVVTALDLAAFDAIGWNLNVDALANNGAYQASTSKILRSYLGVAIPEPATWWMMIGGFGFMGASLRRRRMATASAVA